MDTLKIDLHVHSRYSRDCSTTFREIVAYAKMRGLDGVAITDHDVIEGALKFAKRDWGIIVIPGIEVSTCAGHILGLNVSEPITPNLTPAETIEKVHDAGGIAVVAHPSAIYKGGVGLGALPSLRADAVEVINSSVIPFHLLTYLNRKVALKVGLPQTAGSDSHIPETIGLAYTLIHAESSLDEIIESIRKGRTEPYGKPIPWSLRLKIIRQRKKRE